jgi:hypothetical protein
LIKSIRHFPYYQIIAFGSLSSHYPGLVQIKRINGALRLRAINIGLGVMFSKLINEIKDTLQIASPAVIVL